MNKILENIKSWFGPAQGSIKNYVSSKELVRVLLASASAGFGVGIIPALEFLKTNLPSVVTDQSWVPFAAACVVAAEELVRRLNHEDPAPSSDITNINDLP